MSASNSHIFLRDPPFLDQRLMLIDILSARYKNDGGKDVWLSLYHYPSVDKPTTISGSLPSIQWTHAQRPFVFVVVVVTSDLSMGNSLSKWENGE